MKVVLIDDEPLGLQHLEEMLQQDAGITIAGAFTNPNDVIAFFEKNDADIVFLDIHMPEMSGLELAEVLLECKPSLNLVFVTSYDDYAVRAFEINALDYIMKPVTRKRLMKTLQRIKQWRETTQGYSNSNEEMYHITMFQKFSLFDQDRQPVQLEWRTAKAQQLFLYLLHHRGKVVDKSEIIELLWQDFSYSDALAQLYTTIYHIRKTIKVVQNCIKIKNTTKGYMLFLENIVLDVEEFERLIKLGRVISHDTVDVIKSALELYKGEYLQYYDYPWADVELYRLQSLWVETALNLANWYHQEKQFITALKICDEICNRYPLEEEAYYITMKINAELGNLMSVHIQYKRLKKVFKEELNDVPSSYVTEWYENWIKEAII